MFTFITLFAVMASLAFGGDRHVRGNELVAGDKPCKLRVEEVHVGIGGVRGYPAFLTHGRSRYRYVPRHGASASGFYVRMGRDCERYAPPPPHGHRPHAPAPPPRYMPPVDNYDTTIAAVERYRLEQEALEQAHAVAQSANQQAADEKRKRKEREVELEQLRKRLKAELKALKAERKQSAELRGEIENYERQLDEIEQLLAELEKRDD